MGKRKNAPIFIEKALLVSRAYRDIKTPTAYFVLAIFWTKRKINKVKSGKHQAWTIINNGEIEFTYPEATKKYGISASAFSRAIDELREKGFIDIAQNGGGLHKSKNLYELSERWRTYGTPDFKEPKPRPKGPINKGFEKGNRLGRNCKKTKATVVHDKGSTVADDKG